MGVAERSDFAGIGITASHDDILTRRNGAEKIQLGIF